MLASNLPVHFCGQQGVRYSMKWRNLGGSGLQSGLLWSNHYGESKVAQIACLIWDSQFVCVEVCQLSHQLMWSQRNYCKMHWGIVKSSLLDFLGNFARHLNKKRIVQYIAFKQRQRIVENILKVCEDSFWTVVSVFCRKSKVTIIFVVNDKPGI